MTNLCWIRRDLRLHDHASLSHSLKEGETTVVFNFDPVILSKLTHQDDRRVTFIHQCLEDLERDLQKKGSSLVICYGDPVEEIPALAKKLKAKNVYCNRDYEPYAKKRDAAVEKKLKSSDIGFSQFKDSVIFEKDEIKNGSGELYKVFTPYANKWREKLEDQDKLVPDFECSLKNLRKFTNPENILEHPWYKKIGFKENPPLLAGGTKAGLKRLREFGNIMPDYKETRDFPVLEGTSLLSVHIRFGTISIRDMVRASLVSSSVGSKTWLNELIWRDFYQMILDAHPRIEKEAYKPEYDKIKWAGTEKEFKAWCEGETGFPLIDATMRCFKATGMMHNRLRMVVASFLCKILLVNWRKGEEYFAQNLLDYDLAANNGGWQWSSSSGTDAQPYFRIFNPYNQSMKFDADGEFIKTWCPELSHLSSKEIHRPDSLKTPVYPAPIVQYERNREKCLLMYSVVKKGDA